MAYSGEALYTQLLVVLESSDRPDTQTQKHVAEFIAAFEASHRDGVLYFLEAALTASSLHVRQMAALCMKKSINVRWSSFDPEVKARLKSGLIRGIQIDDSDVRTTFGAAFVALFAVEGYDHWPEAPGLLLAMVTDCPNEIIRETAGSTLLMLVEDMTSREQQEVEELRGALVSEKLSSFVAKELLPRVLELAAKVPGSLVFACKMLATLMDSGVGSVALFDEYFSCFWNLLGSVAVSRDPWVRKCVLKGMIKTWDRHPMVILDSSSAVFGFVIECTGDSTDHTLQLEALYFWSHILKNRVEESLRLRLLETLRAHLPTLIPVLMEHTKYTSWDYMSMDESHLEEDNANIPDRMEDVPPRPEGEMGADDDDESATWGTNWTTRKGSALALDYISQVFGQDKEILMFVLDLIEKRLANSEDWEVRESAVLVLGAIARGCAFSMTPYLPKVMHYLIELTRHRKPLMRSIACWCLSRFAAWTCQDQNAGEWLQPVLAAVLCRVIDQNKRVQEAACSALASFIEDGGCQLVNHLQFIVETLVKAFSCYQARNLMILYDAVGTLAQIFGEVLPQSPFGTYLIQPVLQRLGTTETHTPQFLALMECVNSLVQCWELMYADYAEITMKRAMTAVFEVLTDAKVYAATEQASDPPRWDVVSCSMEVISAVVSVLQDRSPLLVSHVSVVLTASAAKELGFDRQHMSIVDMLTICCHCTVPGVLQSGFALIGDLAWHCSEVVANDALIGCLGHHVLSPVRPVCNNVCWALGVLTQSPAGKQRLEPHFQELVLKLIQLLKRESEFILLQNVCITIGRFASAYPELMAPLLPDFIQPWLAYLSRSRNDKEKAFALCGISHAASKSPSLTGEAVMEIAKVVMAFPPWCPQLEACLRLLVQRLTQYPEYWHALGEDARSKIKERISNGR